MRYLGWLSPTGVMLLCLTLTSGCSFGRGSVGDELKADDVQAIKKGVTTRSKIVGLLGAPDRIVEANGRDIFQYYRYDLKAGSFILIIVNFSRFNIRSDDLYVFFNKDGVVDEVVFGKRTDKMVFRFWPFGD
jgi:outer membrane protein assembly factor BamE (lipoprotein component of BamABCDE complex)